VFALLASHMGMEIKENLKKKATAAAASPNFGQ